MKVDDVDAVVAVRDQVETIIFSRIASRLETAGMISLNYRRLWSEIQRLMGAGGKRIRSRIVVLAYQMLGGKDVHSIIPVAAAHELLHMAMLIHDDIIDRDYIRYGVDNVAGSYNAIYTASVADEASRLHYAHSAALLAGDLMLSEAYQLIARADIDPARAIEVQKIFGRGIFEVVGGELLDTEAAFLDRVDLSSEQIALYKTASYTFMLPMLVGASLAGATTSQRLRVVEFARNLGIAFQLRDDVLGVFGDEADTGKTITGDIREGKRTYMVEQFYELASDTQKANFGQLFGKSDISDEEAEQVRGLLIESGALDRTEQAIARYTEGARSALNHLDVDRAFVGDIDELIVLATERRR